MKLSLTSTFRQRGQQDNSDDEGMANETMGASRQRDNGGDRTTGGNGMTGATGRWDNRGDGMMEATGTIYLSLEYRPISRDNIHREPKCTHS